MLALTDAALARFIRGAQAVPQRRRRKWLQWMASRLRPSTPAPAALLPAQAQRHGLHQNSGEAETTDRRVTVIGPQNIAKLVVDAGQVIWLVHKVS